MDLATSFAEDVRRGAHLADRGERLDAGDARRPADLPRRRRNEPLRPSRRAGGARRACRPVVVSTMMRIRSRPTDFMAEAQVGLHGVNLRLKNGLAASSTSFQRAFRMTWSTVLKPIRRSKRGAPLRPSPARSGMTSAPPYPLTRIPRATRRGLPWSGRSRAIPCRAARPSGVAGRRRFLRRAGSRLRSGARSAAPPRRFAE
jgi:hypothetical protein